MILLDTSVLIEYFRNKEKDKTFFYRLSETHSHFAISVITHYEIYVGSNLHQDVFWSQLLSSVALLPFSKDIADEAVLIRKELLKNKKSIGFSDIAIAATARVNNYKIATLNNKDFSVISNLQMLEML